MRRISAAFLGFGRLYFSSFSIIFLPSFLDYAQHTFYRWFQELLIPYLNLLELSKCFIHFHFRNHLFNHQFCLGNSIEGLFRDYPIFWLVDEWYLILVGNWLNTFIWSNDGIFIILNNCIVSSSVIPEVNLDLACLRDLPCCLEVNSTTLLGIVLVSSKDTSVSFQVMLIHLLTLISDTRSSNPF